MEEASSLSPALPRTERQRLTLRLPPENLDGYWRRRRRRPQPRPRPRPRLVCSVSQSGLDNELRDLIKIIIQALNNGNPI